MSVSHQEFSGTVDEHGKLKLDEWQLENWREWLKENVGKRVVIVLDRWRKRRTIRQNRYYFGTIVRFFRDHWSQARRYQYGLPGYTTEETHKLLAQHVLGVQEGPIPGTYEAKSTAGLTTDEFNTKMIDACRALAWDAYQVRIPLPNEPPEETP